MGPEHAELRSRVIRALPDWLVPLVQFNGLVAARLGVTANVLQCLYVLEHLGPSTAGELARRVNLTSGSASRMIDRLVARGYATRRPDPWPRTFGFHEVFHTLVILAAAAHFTAIAGWVIPAGA